MFKRILRYLLYRLKEASTWQGIFLFLTGIGVMVDPELMELIIAVGMSLAGLIGFLFPDSEVPTA